MVSKFLTTIADTLLSNVVSPMVLMIVVATYSVTVDTTGTVKMVSAHVLDCKSLQFGSIDVLVVYTVISDHEVVVTIRVVRISCVETGTASDRTPAIEFIKVRTVARQRKV